MEVIYKVNGKEFTDKKEAEKYEKILAEDAEKKEKLKAEKDARWKEVNDAYQHYTDLLEKYNEDYGDYFTNIFPWKIYL